LRWRSVWQGALLVFWAHAKKRVKSTQYFLRVSKDVQVDVYGGILFPGDVYDVAMVLHVDLVFSRLVVDQRFVGLTHG
jgi:hypothetical protein